MQHLPISSGRVTESLTNLQYAGFPFLAPIPDVGYSQDDGVDPSNRLTHNSGKI